MASPNLRAELKKFANSNLVKNLTSHLNQYERKVRHLVGDLNLRSRDAREKSKKSLDKFTAQLKKTRKGLEKRVQVLVNQESKRLNKAYGEVLTYVKGLAKNEKLATKAKRVKKQLSKTRPVSKSAGSKKTRPSSKPPVPAVAPTTQVTESDESADSTV